MDTTPVPGSEARGLTGYGIIFVHSRLDDYGLSPAQFRVLAHLARRAGDGVAYPAIASISRVCRLHTQTVRAAIRALVKLRLVSREDRRGTTPTYRLLPNCEWQPPRAIGGHPYEADTPQEATRPQKTMECPPSEKESAEGNPLEGDPRQNRTRTPWPLSDRLPANDEQALAQARAVGVPADFAQMEYDRMVSVGWLDGCQRPVQSWPHYVKFRWNMHRSAEPRLHVTWVPRTRKELAKSRPSRNFHPDDYSEDKGNAKYA